MTKRALTFRDYSKRDVKQCAITIFYLSPLLNIKEALAGDSSGSDFIDRSGSDRWQASVLLRADLQVSCSDFLFSEADHLFRGAFDEIKIKFTPRNGDESFGRTPADLFIKASIKSIQKYLLF